MGSLVGSIGLAIGESIGAVGETFDALWARSSFGSSLLVLRSTVDGSAVAQARLDVVVDQRLAGNVLGWGALSYLVVGGVPSVAGVNKGLKTGTLTWVGLHDLLVLAEAFCHLLVLNVVDEDAGSERSWDGGTKLSVAGLIDC